MGDQPRAIEGLVRGVHEGLMRQTMLGATGTGKTFTMANVIQQTGRPALVMAHNKTLAAQLCSEFRALFPNNAVEFFISYYDYYQPEAYLPYTDTYIEKDASINDEIERLRHSATQALLSRRDVIVVASVSAIYGLGSPDDYLAETVHFAVGQEYPREKLLAKLIAMRFERNDTALDNGQFTVRGETLTICPIHHDNHLRLQFFGDELEKIDLLDATTGEILESPKSAWIYPATHYIVLSQRLEGAIRTIEQELEERLTWFKANGKLLEEERLRQRVRYDLEMLRSLGYCSGIENYSRHFTNKQPGEAPYTLLDYFPKDFLTFIDESHATVPQINGMYNGDRARKEVLVEYGFRLPSALDNRPLKFAEFEQTVGQLIFVSATPGPYEKKVSQQQVEQIIRPTGLLDPEVIIRPVEGQVRDLLAEIQACVQKKERVLVTTLTKKMAENLAEFLNQQGVNVKWLHSDIDALQRVDILQELRRGDFDVLVGINLLREGLDLPEVALVAILDADKEGFLRSETSLVQTMGRAARNVNGRVILYADQITGSIQRAVNETNRKRKIQEAHNQKHGITPRSIEKEIHQTLRLMGVPEAKSPSGLVPGGDPDALGGQHLKELVDELYTSMKQAADDLDFERAVQLREEWKSVKRALNRKLYGKDTDSATPTVIQLKAPRNARRGTAKGPRG